MCVYIHIYIYIYIYHPHVLYTCGGTVSKNTTHTCC